VCTALLNSVVTASVLVHLDVAARGVFPNLVFDLTDRQRKGIEIMLCFVLLLF